MIVSETIEEMLHRREGIARLLEEKNLHAYCTQIFCRWHFKVKDDSGKEVWQMKDFDLKKIQRELYDFLTNYKP